MLDQETVICLFRNTLLPVKMTYIALMHICCCCLKNQICCGAVGKNRKEKQKQDRMDLNELTPEFDYNFLDD